MKNKNHEEYHEGMETSKPIINYTPEVLSFRQALVFLDMSASTLYKKTHLRTIRFFKPSNKRIYFLKVENPVKVNHPFRFKLSRVNKVF